MKKLLIILLLPLTMLSQVEEKKFDRVLLRATKENVQTERKVKATARIYKDVITVRTPASLFIFNINKKTLENKGYYIIFADSIKEKNMTILYDIDGTYIAFIFSDRVVMFYDSKKILNDNVAKP